MGDDILKKNGKYRFTLQFGMDSDEEVRAGELLERLGNRKSVVIVAALCEYIEAHPEMFAEEYKIKVSISEMRDEKLEAMIRRIVEERLGTMPVPTAMPADIPDPEPPETEDADILGMLDDLDMFQVQ